MKILKRNISILACAILALCPQHLAAEPEPTIDEYLSLITELKSYRVPKVSVGGISSGFGASKGSKFVAVSYTNKDTQTGGKDDDGSIALGFGFGNPVDGVGLEATIGITSVSTTLWGDGKFGDEGNISVKVHKQVDFNEIFDAASVAFGISNLAGWGSTTENPKNYNLSFTGLSYLGSADTVGLMLTAGYGTAVSDVETTGSFFAGAGVGNSNFSASISTPGDELWLSGTWFPDVLSGSSLSVSVADVTNEQSRKRTIITFGKSW